MGTADLANEGSGSVEVFMKGITCHAPLQVQNYQHSFFNIVF